jgi:hypothetical protein
MTIIVRVVTDLTTNQVVHHFQMIEHFMIRHYLMADVSIETLRMPIQPQWRP